MEKTEAEKILKEKLENAEKILVGIGSEWKKKEGTEEEEVLHAAEKLKNFLDGKDYYIITSLPGEDADRLGFSAGHMAVPHSVSFTEEAWKHYTLWLSCTLNRFKHTVLTLRPGRSAAVHKKAEIRCVRTKTDIVCKCGVFFLRC